MSLSVVIAVRNASGTLARAVESSLDSSVDELLLVLNGCADDSEKIALQLQKKDPRIQLHESPAEGGVLGALHHGCALAQGDYLGRMDADDWNSPNRFAHQLRYAKDRDLDLVSCPVTLENSLGAGMERYVAWVNSLQITADIAAQRFIESPIIQPSVLLKKSAYDRVGGYPDPATYDGPEDYDLWLRLLHQGVKTGQCPDAHLHWHDSASRLTRTHARYTREAMTQCKARHLCQLPQVKEHGLLICGAGPQGKLLVRYLLAEHESPVIHGFLEVDPKKIGQKVHSTPVLPHASLGRDHTEAILLGTVGVNNGRQRTQLLAQENGYELGKNYFPCC